MRAQDLKLAGILVAVWAGLAALLLLQDGLYIEKHEGDTMHLAEIVLRQADGAWPHLDFMTPIGVLATGPIAFFVDLGWGVGRAILAAQVLVAGLLLPALWWVGASRMSLPVGALFGALCLILTMAVIHGEAQPGLSISMHYNRWAWAIAFVALAVALLPATAKRAPLADGLILGLAAACLALIKVTYLVAILPTVLLALILAKSWRSLGVALAAGLAVALAMTLLAGPAFWGAYLGDLLAVARSEIRSAPGASLTALVAAPAYLGGSILALLSVALLRQGKRETEGLLLLTLLPGFVYVTYQNYGNDPQWLYFLGVFLLVVRPGPGLRNGWGWELRPAVTICAAAALMLAMPSLLNLASSPARHFTTQGAEYVPLLPGAPRAQDIRASSERQARVTGTQPLPGFAIPGEDPAMLNGAALAHCQLSSGTVTFFDALANRLAALGHEGRPVLVADLFNAVWMFGDFPALPGGAPWYYGGLPGGAAAELLLVPTCPVHPRVRRQILTEIEALGWTLTPLAEDPLFALLEIGRP